MDKLKTGIMIKEARLKKKYTQSELGDLIGVTNKAISRWERGDSFPDVGILENLSNILDIPIQDIITGNPEVNDTTSDITNNSIDELIRIFKLQKRENRKKFIKKILLLLITLCCVMSGYLGFGNTNIIPINLMDMYVILIIFSVTSILFCLLQNETDASTITRFSNSLNVISIFSIIWCFLFTWCMFLFFFNNNISININVYSIGSFMNYQLMFFYVLNLMILIFKLYKNDGIDVKYFITIIAIHLTSLYGELLHILNSFQGIFKQLILITLILITITVTYLFITKIINHNKIQNNSLNS